MKRALVADAAAIVAAFAVTEAALPSAWLERSYANAAFAWMNVHFVPLSNALPFALGDLEVALAVAALAVLWTRRIPLVLRFTHTLAFAAAIVIAFNLLWGWNYRRAPVAARVDYSDARVTPAAVSAFADRIANILNPPIVSRTFSITTPVRRTRRWPAKTLRRCAPNSREISCRSWRGSAIRGRWR